MTAPEETLSLQQPLKKNRLSRKKKKKGLLASNEIESNEGTAAMADQETSIKL